MSEGWNVTIEKLHTLIDVIFPKIFICECKMVVRASKKMKQKSKGINK